MSLTEKLPEPLSNVPSRAIEQAIEDLLACERDKGCTIDMASWYVPGSAGKDCFVCFAGAVMAKRLGGFEALNNQLGLSLVKFEYGPSDFKDAAIRRVLYALDVFRLGNVRTGLALMGISTDKMTELGIPERVDVESYNSDRDGFFRDMRSIVEMLRGVGL